MVAPLPVSSAHGHGSSTTRAALLVNAVKSGAALGMLADKAASSHNGEVDSNALVVATGEVLSEEIGVAACEAKGTKDAIKGNCNIISEWSQ